jgi:hypothetical protein
MAAEQEKGNNDGSGHLSAIDNPLIQAQYRHYSYAAYQFSWFFRAS